MKLCTWLTSLLCISLACAASAQKPRVSIITSVFKGDEFIKGFLEDITAQTIFHQCELILINANSPDNEEPIIKEYMAKYPNIIYKRLAKDPGLYKVWNKAIKMASGDLITNANLDDRRNPSIIETHANYLEQHPAIDLVYSNHFITYQPNETFANNNYKWVVEPPEFSPEALFKCLPGPQPMWRKSMHHKVGFFRPDYYIAGDLEMWNRAASKGALFKKIHEMSGLFYMNFDGLSNAQDTPRVFKKNKENDLICRAYGPLWNKPDKPKLLIKIPTRERPQQFFAMLDKCYQKLSGKIPYQFLISCDSNDFTMHNDKVIKQLKRYPYLTVTFSNNKSKVEACNANIQAHNFDIIVLASDDMEPLIDNFDAVIVDQMNKHFPDGDGVLHFHDGYVGSECNTLPIVGKKFYDRFGYMYHPSYRSFFCNEELTLISKILKKEAYTNQILMRHNHPVWSAGIVDDLYIKNERYKEYDRALFNQRREAQFFLEPHDIIKSTPKLWSILICTLDEREAQFAKLHDKLQKQIKDCGLQNEIEILLFKDNREHKVGYKRNQLIEQSNGKYVCFLDDDDDIHEQYIEMIYKALQTDPDCVKLVGIMSTNGTNPQKFVHSLEFNTRYEYDMQGQYFVRPPNHLNPIRRSIACQFLFPEANFGEDKHWAMAIANSKLLKTEAVIDEPYYFYLYTDSTHDNIDVKQTKANHGEQVPQSYEPSNSQEIPTAIEATTIAYFATAADSNYYEPLLNLIGSISRVHGSNLGKIAVFNIGLTENQIQELNTIEKVEVFEVEKVHPDILKPMQVSPRGKTVPGWYAWKPVAFKQALDLFPYVLWLDAGTTVLKPLTDLFEYIKQHGYFLGTIGNEYEHGSYLHPVRWQTTQHLVKKFNLNSIENSWILDQEAVMGNVFGATMSCKDIFALPAYELAKDLSNFADDGSTPQGFGTARHDQMVLTVLAYTKHLTILKQDYTQEKPMDLMIDGKPRPLYITWHPGYICDKTHIYSSRGDLSNKEYYLQYIKHTSK